MHRSECFVFLWDSTSGERISVGGGSAAAGCVIYLSGNAVHVLQDTQHL